LSKGKIEKPNLLKIDALGEELRVLQESAELFDEAEVFIIRTSLLKICPECNGVHELIGFMAEKNFHLFDVADYRRESKENDFSQINLVFASAQSAMVVGGK
jgi:hypothetical protein